MVVIARRLSSQFPLLRPPLPTLLPPLQPVEKGLSNAVRELRADLEPRIASRLSSGTELIRALERQRRQEVVPTGLQAIDCLLEGGLSRGKMTEIAGRGARFSVVIAALAAATSIGEAAALIDRGNGFDPQLGEAAGIDLDRMLWVRPDTLKQAVTAAEMLVSTGFQLVVLDVEPAESRPYVASPLRRSTRVPDAAWVRLARAAEAHGSALLISAPYPLTGTASVAMLLAERARARWRGGLLTGVQTSIRLEKHRRKRPGEAVETSFEIFEARTADRGPRAAMS
jgi:hypothetical protein